MTKRQRSARTMARSVKGVTRAHFEVLEPRQLLSATWTINGTPGADVIVVNFDQSTSQITVAVNNTTATRPAAKVKKIVINGGKGDDTITVNLGSHIIPCTINGGAGNDTITCPDGTIMAHGNAGDDVINGGIGNDTLYGDAGNDKIYGGAGNDKIFGGAGDDLLVGGTGADKYSDGSGHNILYVALGVDTASKFRFNTIENAEEPAPVVATSPTDSTDGGTNTAGSAQLQLNSGTLMAGSSVTSGSCSAGQLHLLNSTNSYLGSFGEAGVIHSGAGYVTSVPFTGGLTINGGAAYPHGSGYGASSESILDAAGNLIGFRITTPGQGTDQPTVKDYYFTDETTNSTPSPSGGVLTFNAGTLTIIPGTTILGSASSSLYCSSFYGGILTSTGYQFIGVQAQLIQSLVTDHEAAQSIVNVSTQSGTLTAAPLFGAQTVSSSSVICLANGCIDLTKAVVTTTGPGIWLVNGGTQTLISSPIVDGSSLQTPTPEGQLVV